MPQKIELETVKEVVELALKTARLEGWGCQIEVDGDEKWLNIGTWSKSGNILINEFSISESTKKIRSILGESEVPSWQLSQWKYYGGGRWEPPSEDLVEMGNFQSMWDVAQEVTLAIVKDGLERAFENKSYEMFPEFEGVS